MRRGKALGVPVLCQVYKGTRLLPDHHHVPEPLSHVEQNSGERGIEIR